MESRSVEPVQLGPEAEFPLGQLKTSSPDGHTVAELLPPGFDRYVRIFHPFFAASVDEPEAAAGAEIRTWQSLAEEAGAVFHPEIVWASLIPALPEVQTGKGARSWWVSEGRLEEPARGALYALLARYSTEPDAFFLYSLARSVKGKEPLLFRADLGAIREVQAAAEAGLDPAWWLESPEWVWPPNASWVVNTDIDLQSTYVACAATLADALLSDPILEAVDVGLGTRVDHRADRVNRPHERFP